MENVQRKTCRAQVTKLVNGVKDLLQKSDEELTNEVEELSVMITRLQTANENLQRANEKILPTIDESQYESEFEKVLEYEDNVTASIARLKERIKRINKKSSMDNSEVVSNASDSSINENNLAERASDKTHTRGSCKQGESLVNLQSETASVGNLTRHNKNVIKLPRLELKKFNGELEQWTPFWEQFKTMVHENVDLDYVTKFSYLQAALTGKAALTIQGLTSSEACYEDAIDMLKNEYGNTQKLIDSYVQRLMAINPIKNRNDTSGLRRLYNATSSITRTLKSLGVDANQYGMMVKSVLVKAIPYKMKIDFYKKDNETDNSTDYEEQIESLLSFIKLEVESMELAEGATSKRDDVKEHRKFSNSKVKEFTAAGLFTKVHECLFCKSKSHATSQCNDAKTIQQRKDILRKNGRCFRCTKANHSSKFCKTKDITCNKCKGRHATSMCDPNYQKLERSVAKTVTPANQEQQSTNLLTKNLNINNVFLQTACAYLSNNEKGQGAEVFVRLILDGGSQLTFIKETVSRQLKLKVIGTHKISILPFGSSKRSPAKLCNRVSLTLISQYSPQPIQITAIEVPEICLDTMPVPHINDPVIKTLIMADERIGGYEPTEGISLLVGADFYWNIVTGEHVRISSNLTAVNTKLGWTLHGPNSENEDMFNVNIATVLRVETQEENDVNELKKFWDLETIGISNQEDTVSEFTNEFLRKNIVLKEDRYEVTLPWKDREMKLCDNYENAVSRVKTLTSRLIRNDRLLEYDNAIREYVKNNCAELGPNETDPIKTYYMPHKPVYRDDKTTTRLRVVFDASSRMPGLASLNEHLVPGDNLIQDLLRILMNFRIGNVALVADIEKAFLQIGIAEQDRDSHSFLWYEQPIKSANELPALRRYRMTRVTFGVTCSPYLLTATLKKHLTTQSEHYEGSCEKLLNALYVDDLVIGLQNFEEAKVLYDQSKFIMESAGMNLRKWNTNDQNLREYIFKKEQQETSTNNKVLGLCWQVQSDTLSTDLKPTIKINEGNVIPTKRNVLSGISKIYDPLGFLGPFLIRAKLLLQSIWKLKLDWDSLLPLEIANEWNKWNNEIEVLKEFSISRTVIKNKGSVQLHVFADASPKAYGVAAYIREQLEDGTYTVGLLLAKNRVAPIKEDGNNELTVPRLELTAFVCAARLQDYIIKNIGVEIQRVYLWTDSKITLCWITSDSSKWKPYVANRVTEIKRLTKNCVIKYCPGNDNPADLLTRGVKAKVLLESKSWTKGPCWLRENEKDWPSDYVRNDTDAIVFLTNFSDTINLVTMPVFPINKFEKFERLIRVTAYTFRFINNARVLSIKKRENLSVDELEEAERYWIKYTQKTEFKVEYKCLLEEKAIDSTSSLLTLNPFLDENKIMRLGGRLQETTLPYNTKHPIILPNKSVLTEKLIWDVHRRNHHGGVNLTLSKLRERFWIIRGRQRIKSIIRQCITCKKLLTKTATAPFAPLPKNRVDVANPFEHIGVDFAGPLYIRDTENNRKKTYIMLLTCAVTRAVHLELVLDISTESCIRGFRRFISRRGVPSVIYSDNAKTFKRTSLEIDELKKIMESEEVQEFAQQKRIHWRFIVERAAWWGGFWERLVKSVKEALKSTLGRATLMVDELQTTLVEVEATINSRPLTYIDEDPNNLLILTPSHFLIGQNNSGIVMDLSKKEFNRNVILRQWKRRQEIVAKYWKKWSKDYLQQLRSAHHVKKQDSTLFQVGDVAMLNEPNLPRLSWKLVRISEVYMGRDGKIRACRVLLPNGSYLRRPIQLLSPLELGGEDVEKLNHREVKGGE